MGNPAMKPLDHWYRYAGITRHASDCWLWTGPQQSSGYGDMNITHATTRGAHRFSYQTFVGPIPEGMSVLHRCDVPACVRPSHLFLGTQADNMADKRVKGRAASRSRNGAAKLTDEQFRALERRHAAGERQTDLARDYGVSVQAVSQYLKRRRLEVAS